MAAVVSSGTAVFGTLASLWPPDEAVKTIIDMARGGSSFLNNLDSFYNAVNAAKDGGTLDWLEDSLPSPYDKVVDLFKLYCGLIDTLAGTSFMDAVEDKAGFLAWRDEHLGRIGACEHALVDEGRSKDSDAEVYRLKQWLLSLALGEGRFDASSLFWMLITHQLNEAWLLKGGTEVQERYFPGRWPASYAPPPELVKIQEFPWFQNMRNRFL